MLPLLEKEVVQRHKWLSHEELIDVFALGQSTPGIIALNVATYVGVGQRGIPGAIAATAGMVAPSLVIICIISSFLSDFSSIALVQSIFSGIRAVVAGLLLTSVYKLGLKAANSVLGILLVLAGFVMIVFIDISPLYIVLLGGISGIVVYSLKLLKVRQGD